MDIIPQDTPQIQCTKCKEFFPATSEFFGKSKRTLDMWRHQCKKCRKAEKPEPTIRTREIEEIPVGHKRCFHCKHILPFSSYALSKNNKYGIDVYCKECNKQKREEKKEQYNETKRRYRESHREELRKKDRQWEATHRERKRAQRRLSDLKHRDRAKVYYKEWRHTERGKIIRRVHSRNRHALKKTSGIHTIEDIQAQLHRQRQGCYYCHKKLSDKYHVDHVIPLARGGTNDASNLVITCPTCNLKKGTRLPHEFFEGGRLL